MLIMRNLILSSFDNKNPPGKPALFLSNFLKLILIYCKVSKNPTQRIDLQFNYKFRIISIRFNNSPTSLILPPLLNSPNKAYPLNIPPPIIIPPTMHPILLTGKGSSNP